MVQPLKLISINSCSGSHITVTNTSGYLEFQERGAPHFHILVDKEIPHQKVAKSWYRIVGSGDEKHLKAGTEVRAIRAKDSIGYYLTTYMEKARQKSVPPEYEKVGRFWGSSKGLLQEKKMKIFGKREDIYQIEKIITNSPSV